MTASLTKTQSYTASHWEEQVSDSSITSEINGDALWVKQILETNDINDIPSLSLMEISSEAGSNEIIIQDNSVANDYIGYVDITFNVPDSSIANININSYINFLLDDLSQSIDSIDARFGVFDNIVGNDLVQQSSIDIPPVNDSLNSNDEVDTRFVVFDGFTGIDSIGQTISYIPVNDIGSAVDNINIEVYFSIQSVYEADEWVGYKVKISDWSNYSENITHNIDPIVFTETATGTENEISISYEIYVSDSSVSEEILEFLKLATLLDNSIGQDEILLNIFQHVDDSLISAIDNVYNVVHAKVRQYTNITDSIYPSNFSNFLDNVTGDDSVGISQICSVQDFGYGFDQDPKGCGVLYDNINYQENISVGNYVVISDSVIGEEVFDIKKLFTVSDSGFGNDLAEGGFYVGDICETNENVRITNSVVVSEDALMSDDATQAFSGLEGDIVIKITNSEGKIRIKRLLEFFRSSYYTFKIKDQCKGDDSNVRKII